MSLKDLIRGKKVPDKFATATVATFATQTPEERRTVASVATVTVAIPAAAKPAIQISDDAAAVSRWWRFHYIEREPKEVMYSPPVNHAEALSGEPDATSAEPFEPTRRKPDRTLSMEEEAKIRGWLAYLGEADEATIAAVLAQCRTDADARNGYLRDAKNSNENRRWLS